MKEKHEMNQLKFISFERKLDLPLYSLSEKKSRQKSCFVDSNRVDTVPPAITEKKQDKKKTELSVGDKDKS